MFVFWLIITKFNVQIVTSISNTSMTSEMQKWLNFRLAAAAVLILKNRRQLLTDHHQIGGRAGLGLQILI